MWPPRWQRPGRPRGQLQQDHRPAESAVRFASTLMVAESPPEYPDSDETLIESEELPVWKWRAELAQLLQPEPEPDPDKNLTVMPAGGPEGASRLTDLPFTPWNQCHFELPDLTTYLPVSRSSRFSRPDVRNPVVSASVPLESKLPEQNVAALVGMELAVGRTYSIIPAALAVEDRTLGCFLLPPNEPNRVLKELEKLNRDMVAAYHWPMRRKSATDRAFYASRLPVGSLVAVKLPDSKLYRRGFLESMTVRGRAGIPVKARIFLLDIGIPVYVPTEFITALHPQFAALPPLAAVCTVRGLEQSADLPSLYKKLQVMLHQAAAQKLKIEGVVMRTSSGSRRNAGSKCRLFLELFLMIEGKDVTSPRLRSFVPKEMTVPENGSPEVGDEEELDERGVVEWEGFDSLWFVCDLAEALNSEHAQV